jgi:hypothetical protein
MTGKPKNNRNTRERGIANNATKSRNSPVAKNVGHIKKSRPNQERPDAAEDVDIDFQICLIEIVACRGWWPTISPAKVAALWQRRAQLWARLPYVSNVRKQATTSTLSRTAVGRLLPYAEWLQPTVQDA